MADLDLDALRSELQESLEPGEDMDDVLATVRHLADRRANALGRETEQADLEFTASILCWYPFKTPPPDDYRATDQGNPVRTDPWRGTRSYGAH
jgi:hypothetical protein